MARRDPAMPPKKKAKNIHAIGFWSYALDTLVVCPLTNKTNFTDDKVPKILWREAANDSQRLFETAGIVSLMILQRLSNGFWQP